MTATPARPNFAQTLRFTLLGILRSSAATRESSLSSPSRRVRSMITLMSRTQHLWEYIVLVLTQGFSVQELNLFAMTFLDTISSEHILALLHVDHQQRTQLISRTLDIPSLELSPSLSPVLPNSVIPPNTFPTVDPSPSLITIPAVCSSSEDGMGTQSVHPGGVLVLGGRKLLFFEMATEDRQQFKREKQSRLEKRKASTSITDNHIAREKEKERESRRVKPKASLKWPWSDITT